MKGGISCITKRYSKANNNTSSHMIIKNQVYITFKIKNNLYKNNLYDWEMSQYGGSSLWWT